MQVRWLAALATILPLVACGGDDSGDVDNDPSRIKNAKPGEERTADEDPAVVKKKLEERPWEVVSNKGETYLPNVFYADPVENEQIMPYAIDGHVMIDRLVYPTLGNPNLYTKSDANEEFVSVLRIEESAFKHLAPKLEPVDGSSLSRLVIPNDAANGFAFFLVPRAAREPNTESKTAISNGQGTDVIRIFPHEILVNPEPADMPAALKKRKTLRFVFKQGAMAKVPAGLYDLRFEMRQTNAIKDSIYEYQYNAVRVFDNEPEEYQVVNVTDTQVSVGDLYGGKTREKLDEFVQFMNTTNDPNVRKASFITFNGDLHNGGSPGSLRQRTVAHTYENEAKAIVGALKYLPIPIFLTAGNHDGYVSVGHVPGAVKTAETVILESLPEVIDEVKDKPWANFSMSDFQSFLQKSEAADNLGGLHRDLFTGGFARTAGAEGFASWKEIPKADRNYVLYDGFYQWQKTYGPLYYSYKFGKNFYLSLNSFELRQHRRSGWGMYTVNYGGGISDTQMNWIDRELLRGKTDGADVIVLAHHDPRGGHKGKDQGYYYEQLEYKSVYQSAINYMLGKAFNPIICKLPGWALSEEQTDSCVHDGLQEWMRPDTEFDCAWNQRKADFTCDASKMEVPWTSSMELLKRLSVAGQVRTAIYGHTHYNELEVLQKGDELVPVNIAMDPASKQKFATLEVVNPLRGYAETPAKGDYDQNAVPMNPIEKSLTAFANNYNKAVAGWDRKLTGGELVVLRLVSNADLTHQTYTGKNALGFSVLDLTKKADARNVGQAQINKVHFFANTGAAQFSSVGTIDIDRNVKMKPHDPTNPVEKLYDM